MRYASIGLPGASPRRAFSDLPTPEHAQSGFTLFETLTAMLVLSIGLVTLFEAHSRALKTAGIAADYLSARILAQGLLADATGGRRGKLAPRQGTDNGFAWKIDVAPEAASWANVKVRDDWKLQRVRVIVSWNGGRQLELDTVKLRRPNG